MKKFLFLVCVVLFSSSFVVADEQVSETACANTYQACEQDCEKQRLPDEKGNQCYSKCLKDYEECKGKININTIEKK